MHGRTLSFSKHGTAEKARKDFANLVADTFYTDPPDYVGAVTRLDITFDCQTSEVIFRPVVKIHDLRQTAATVKVFWPRPRGIVTMADKTGKITWTTVDLEEEGGVPLDDASVVEGIVECLYDAVRLALRLLYLDYIEVMSDFAGRQKELEEAVFPIQYSLYIQQRLGMVIQQPLNLDGQAAADGAGEAGIEVPGVLAPERDEG